MYSVKEKRLPQLVAIVRLSWKPYHKLTPPFISSSGTVTYPLRLSAFSMYMAGNSLLFFYYKVVLTSTVELARYSWEGPNKGLVLRCCSSKVTVVERFNY